MAKLTKYGSWWITPGIKHLTPLGLALRVCLGAATGLSLLLTWLATDKTSAD